MRYMMVIHNDDEALANANQQQLWADYAAFNQALAKAGAGFTSGERMQSGKDGTIVRSRAGKTDVLDGPYTDTKEQFAGYFFIDVATLEEAVEWANRCPSSRFGTIEIRQVVDAGKN
jgi:hypothetical protein